MNSKKAATPANKHTTEASITFADVLQAISAATDLTDGVRSNMRSAVERCASLCSPQGVTATIDLQSVAKRLDKLTPAKLGFRNDNSLAAFKSNLRRALRLAGCSVMPGRHVLPLSRPWAELAMRLRTHDDGFLWPALSRFVHYLSERGVPPDCAGPEAFADFLADLRATNLGSKADKVVRNTARAWERARVEIEAWPETPIIYERRKSDIPLLQWSAFPHSLEEDARRFVERDEDWLSIESLAADGKRPLRPATRDSYLSGLQRAASIRVALGTSPERLQSLADLVEPEHVRAVLKSVSGRTGRERGGHVGFLALLLYMAARDHVRLTGSALARLEAFSKRTRREVSGMSDRTLSRYTQFDSPVLLDRLIRLPTQLMTAADRMPAPDICAAKRARLALYLSLLFEVCARSGNIVALDLDRHIVTDRYGRDQRMFVVIPPQEVKNDEEIRSQLSSGTARMLRRYVDRYRSLHCDRPSPWLFPRRDGTHWTTSQAYTDLKDLAARYVGADVTPHLIRSLVGKIILDARPGAIATVQQLLAHKRLDTTIRYYARLNPQKAREEYQSLLEARR